MKSAKTLTVSTGILSNLGHSCLWIHTASSPQMGYGHLKRTMTLARFLSDCWLPLFLIDPQDRWSRERQADRGMAFVYETLDSVWSHIPDPKAILIDTRDPNSLDGFLAEAKNRCVPVISVHDLGLDPLASDIAIDGSIAPDFSQFPNPNADFYGGPSYIMLDPVYRLLHQQDKFIGDRIRTVFINLGGGNTGRYFEKVLEGLMLWNRELEVIGVPGFSSWGQELLSRRIQRPLHFQWVGEGVESCCFKADLAITAGGLSAYEALCAGTPLLALSHDRHQETTIRTLSHEDVCIDLGRVEDFDPAVLPVILTGIENDREKRCCFCRKGRNVVDGCGIERVAQIIRESIGACSNASLLEGVG